MRTFPVKTPIGPIQKVTPTFNGFNHRGIIPTQSTRYQTTPTSQAEIKVLSSTNMIPLVNISERYRSVTHRVNFTRDNSHRKPTPAILNKSGKKSNTISTYNFE